MAGLISGLGVLAGKRVLLTGHTGFKGGWTAVWLHALGAEVTGFALPPDTTPSLFEAVRVGTLGRSVFGDVRDRAAVTAVVREVEPDVVLHLAAQPLVRRSYAEPVETLDINVLGTAHLLEAVRETVRDRGDPCVVIVVTSDKCYANTGSDAPHREGDRLGGHDPYSASKAMAELAVEAWRHSYFPVERLSEHGVALASVRAGNVVGGGDWSADRLVPDVIRALASGAPVAVRNPAAIRPWQHVLDPIAGYLGLAAALLERPSPALCDAFNFGPSPDRLVTVGALVDALHAAWGSGRVVAGEAGPYESPRLVLASDRARERLGWTPRWDVDATVARTVAWYQAHQRGEDLAAFTRSQIAEYTGGTA